MPPRQSATAAKTFSPTGSRASLMPPPDLDAVEKEVFADLVYGTPKDFFWPGDVPLIAHLARNIVLVRVAFGEMKAAGYVAADRASPWLQILQHASKEMRASARMLGLTPTSYRPQPKAEDLEGVSYCTRVSLLEGRTDEPN